MQINLLNLERMKTLYSLTKLIENIAKTQPNVRTAFEGDVYKLDTDPSVKYGVFCLTQGTHTETEETITYNYSMFYVDRLEQNLEENRLQIQSVGIQVISNILKILAEDYDVDITEHNYQPFTQKFRDETAGQLCTVSITVYKDWSCADEYDGVANVITLTENGTYNVGGFTVKVDVGLQ